MVYNTFEYNIEGNCSGWIVLSLEGCSQYHNTFELVGNEVELVLCLQIVFTLLQNFWWFVFHHSRLTTEYNQINLEWWNTLYAVFSFIGVSTEIQWNAPFVRKILTKVLYLLQNKFDTFGTLVTFYEMPLEVSLLKICILIHKYVFKK